ncbi:MAG: DM13 domain-containing protein [Candidatus Binatia bacterium]
MQRRSLIILSVLLIGGTGWYLFRPERLFVNATVSEEFPQEALAGATTVAGAQVLASGRFHDVAHQGVGTATVYQLADGKRVLRFSAFATSNGPDVQVYLVATDDARDNETVTKAGFVHIGALKGNIGDQNYDLPADLDLAKYRAVTIWCRRFGVNFATAPLTTQAKS